jgi:hypothetical protein
VEYFKHEPWGDDQITFLLAWLLSMVNDALKEKDSPSREPKWFLWQLRDREMYAPDEVVAASIRSAINMAKGK